MLVTTTDGKYLIEQGYDANNTVAYTCFGNGTHVDCIGSTGVNAVGVCNSYNYRNGKKLSSNGECCSSSSDCKGACGSFVCY